MVQVSHGGETAAMGVGSSSLDLDAAGSVTVSVKVAAMLDPEPNEAIRSRPYSEQPYW